MNYNRHHKWHEVMSMLGDIADKHGSTIHDYRCGKNWDVGQAVCAEAYGENWMQSERFQEADKLPDSEPPDEIFYEACVRLTLTTPEWMKESL